MKTIKNVKVKTVTNSIEKDKKLDELVLKINKLLLLNRYNIIATIIDYGLILINDLPRCQRSLAMANLEHLIKETIPEKDADIQNDTLLLIEKIYPILKIKMI